MKLQQLKSSATREQILKATVQSLIEVGLVSTTLERISQVSGQSRGAINYHFPTRDMLVRETLLYIQRERISAYRAAMTDEARELAGFERSVEIYWETFCDPLYVAYEEVVSQARTDRHLAAFLIPIRREFEAEWDQVVLNAHPGWADSVELFRRTRTIATFLMTGMARERLIFGADEAWMHSIRQDLKAWMHQMIVAERSRSSR